MVVHPGEQRLLLGHQGRAFFMPAKTRGGSRNNDIGGCHSVRFDIAHRVKSSSFNQRNRQPLFYSAKTKARLSGKG